MSNSRRFRRGLAASRQSRAAGMIRPGAWKDRGRAPTLGAVRKWIHAAKVMHWILREKRADGD